MDTAIELAKEMIAEIAADLKSGQTSLNEDGGLYARKAALEEFLRRLAQKR